MRSQNQYTIYALNDVVTQSTAPSNPYKGELWVDTSKSPPVTMVYNGSKWVEQNGTDTIRTSIKTVEDKQAEFSTSLEGLTSTVESNTRTIEALDDGLGTAEENITSIQSDVSTLQQTTSDISATVSNKVDNAYGSSSSSFGWSLKSDGFYVYSNASTVVSITSSGLTVSGQIVASSGTLSELTVIGKLYFGNNKSYYIGPNYSNSSWYIYLKNFRVDETNAYFSGQLSAPSGTIGGFTISTSKIYSVKTTYSDTNDGVYIGTDGIGLGKGIFYVTSTGEFHGSNVYITGEINATSGYFENCEIGASCNIYGYLYMSGSEEVKFYGTKTTMTYETWMGGTGIISNITNKSNSGTTTTSYSYIRPFGITIVPDDYKTSANDGMLFGIMQSYSFKTQSLLAGASFYYYNDGTNIFSEVIMRCGDSLILDAALDTTNGNIAYWGSNIMGNYLNGQWCINDCLYVYNSNSYIGTTYMSSTYYGCLHGRWHVDGSFYMGTATTGYMTTTTQNSTTYPYLANIWYAYLIYFGSYTSYHIRIDSDQITWYYSTTQVGELESYSTYTDVQGTWKTNGSAWISSSDRNLKEEINEVDDVYGELFDRLVPVTYKWKDGTSGRTHIGFIAQDVKEATEACGLTTQQFAAYVHFDATEKNDEVIPETCGIRYEEITPLNTWEIQKLKKRVAELEKKLEELS